MNRALSALKPKRRLPAKKHLTTRNVVFVVGFTVAAVVMTYIVTAAPFTANFEAEDAQRTGNATIVNASGTSGNEVIRFNQPSTPPTNPPTNPPITTGKRCNLYLHAAGQNGNANDFYRSDGVHELQPRSPAGAFWEYDGPHNYQQTPQTGEAEYQQLVTYLRNYVTANNCGPTVVRGSSNGGGLAAKLYCRGEDFGGRAWGYIVDDPVMDVAVVGCNPSPNITRTYFTHSQELKDNAAATAPQNFNCAYAGWGWYCQDNRTMTLETYESHIDTNSVKACETHSGGGCTYTMTGSHVSYVFWEDY